MLINMGVIPVYIKHTINDYFRLIIKQLSNMSVFTILIEGGGETVADALKANVVDELFQFIAPKIVGGRTSKTPVEGLGITKMADATPLRTLTYTRIGPDLLIRGRVK
jgi:diaminohydroxyphosphoribosylaminopyrimidine deaminase/5-amino-6-(5-phosphoribosylamino)uracil reductase